MKTFRLFTLLVLLSIVSCTTWRNVPDRLDEFVDKAQKSSSKYSPEDWQKNTAEFKELINIYAEHRDQYTPEETARVMKDIGRYHALLVVHGISEAILPSILEGINENMGEAVICFDDILNPEGVDRAVRGFRDE